jgi:hypothetical protein
MLGDRGRAYAFAQSGAPLSQYVAYARHGCAAYHPQKLVVTIVGNDFDESIYGHRTVDGMFHLHPRPDGSFGYKLTPYRSPGLPERIARNSALALYLVRNVGAANLLQGFLPARAQAADDRFKYAGNTLTDANPARVAEGERVIAWLLDALPREACLAPRDIVLVLDAVRPYIYADGNMPFVQASYFGRMRAKLIADATARGFIVVDMEPRFRAAAKADGQWFEYPTDNHWNPHGHAVVAQAVREALGDWPPLQGMMSQRRP